MRKCLLVVVVAVVVVVVFVVVVVAALTDAESVDGGVSKVVGEVGIKRKEA